LRAMAPRWVVPLSDVLVDDDLREAVDEVVRSGWWSMGPRVAAFEDAFAASCETRHAIAVANGTAALHIALLAAGCGPGDDVVLPSLNFVAAANAIVHTGARPVFCDIVGPSDLNLDPGDLEAALTKDTKAIVALHYAGTPCDMEAVLALAERHGLVVIEDAAHAPGARWRGRPCGSVGAIGCFSFFSNKNLPVGEGGMIVTDDDELARSMRLLRSHGMTTLTWDRHRGHAHDYEVVAPGFNYRLDELRAAMGLVQLQRLERGNEQRRALVDRYTAAFASVEDVDVPSPVLAAGTITAAHIAPVVLADSIDRDALRQRLSDRGIQTSVHYPPIHRFERYRTISTRPLERTDAVARRLLTLPLYPHMGEERVDLVTSAVLEALVVSEAA
jgi:dTDP-4-amino-4,6-dideoxygalactose transaminase